MAFRYGSLNDTSALVGSDHEHRDVAVSRLVRGLGNHQEHVRLAASETHALRPVTVRSPPTFCVAFVVIAVASEPACGSVRQNPPSAAPSTKGCARPGAHPVVTETRDRRGDRVMHRYREG